MKTPNTKIQTPEKLQAAEVAEGIGDLDIGIYLELGVWCLVFSPRCLMFGSWDFVFPQRQPAQSPAM